VTGVAGHVAEPYLQSAVRPEVLFPAYASGFNLAEAFYLALPDLSWQSVVVGDPLCAPFVRPAVAAADLDPPLDPATELPALFAARRLDFMRTQAKGVPDAVLPLVLRGEGRVSRGDDAGAREVLEEATKQAPDLPAAQLQLALLYEQAEDHVNARARYHEVLRLESDNAIALNNLAYSLAVHDKSPKEGVPFARRAYVLFPRDPRVVDTLAWIEHLSGNSAEAARLLRNMVQRDVGLAEVHLHAAIVFAATGDLREAERQLNTALKRDPALEESADVKQLRARLKKG
jgi:Flp pilus assembly protein TadD